MCFNINILTRGCSRYDEPLCFGSPARGPKLGLLPGIFPKY
jgi:hypothetical protein